MSGEPEIIPAGRIVRSATRLVPTNALITSDQVVSQIVGNPGVIRCAIGDEADDHRMDLKLSKGVDV
jgi:hypothetical protein